MGYCIKEKSRVTIGIKAKFALLIRINGYQGQGYITCWNKLVLEHKLYHLSEQIVIRVNVASLVRTKWYQIKDCITFRNKLVSNNV